MSSIALTKEEGFASCTEGVLHNPKDCFMRHPPRFILRLTMKHCSASLHNMKQLRYEALTPLA